MPGRRDFLRDEVPEGMEKFIELNAELAEIWPNITEKKESLPDAEEWDGKRQDQRPRTLIASRSLKGPCGPFAFLEHFSAGKKRGGMTRPHFILVPVFLFIILMNRILRRSFKPSFRDGCANPWTRG
jgi:hypothetical protein